MKNSDPDLVHPYFVIVICTFLCTVDYLQLFIYIVTESVVSHIIFTPYYFYS